MTEWPAGWRLAGQEAGRGKSTLLAHQHILPLPLPSSLQGDPEQDRLARWTTCQLSGMPLAPPCVADELGFLFNKDAVLQARRGGECRCCCRCWHAFRQGPPPRRAALDHVAPAAPRCSQLPQALLSKAMPRPLGHITSLKCVTELKLEAASDSGGAGSGTDGARFACPVTGQALNGKARFVVLRRTGHVVSERALKEVRGRGAAAVLWVRAAVACCPAGGHACCAARGEA